MHGLPHDATLTAGVSSEKFNATNELQDLYQKKCRTRPQAGQASLLLLGKAACVSVGSTRSIGEVTARIEDRSERSRKLWDNEGADQRSPKQHRPTRPARGRLTL